MNFKKITAMIIAFCMVVSILPVVSFAIPSTFTKYYANDNFVSGTDGWEVGPSQPGFEATMRLKSANSADDNYDANVSGAKDGKALYVNLPKQNASVTKPSNYGNVTRALDGVATFENNKEIILETRIKKVTASSAYLLRINRPNTLSQVNTDYAYKDHYALFGYTTADAYPGMLMIKSINNNDITFDNNGRWATSSNNKAEFGIIGKWVTYKIVFKPETGKYKVYMTYTKDDGTEYTILNGREALMKAPKNNIEAIYGTGRWMTVASDAYHKNNFFDTLERLTFTAANGGDGEIYVDYVKVYEQKETVSATLSLTNGTYMRTSDNVEIVLSSDKKITSVPENAFTLSGVETNFAYDAEAKKVTLSPKSGAFTPGSIYQLTVDTSLLEEKEGIYVSGATSYNIEISDVNVNNLTATGRIIPGNVITATFDYSSSKPEGDHEYQWQVSATGEENSFTDIEGDLAKVKDYTVTSAESGKYLRLKMIPCGKDAEGNSTLFGFETYSNIVHPEKPPYAENVKLSTNTLFPGIYITATYDFVDNNGDKEDVSEITWYTSDTDGGELTLIHTGKTYEIKESDIGKYITAGVKPKSISVLEPVGEIEYSEAFGPVVDIMATTNMFYDPGLETGVLGDKWVYSNNWSGATLQSVDVHSGNYAIYLPARTALNDNFGQKMDFKSGRTYIIGAWAKKTSSRAADINGVTVFAGGGDALVSTSGNEETFTLTDKWKHIVFGYRCTRNTSPNTGFVSWTDMKTAEMYLDDLYCGELLIGDIKTVKPDPVKIPETGEEKVSITNGEVLNQLGTKAGLENETVKVKIPETQGVYVDEANNVVVTERAYPGVITAEIYVEPEYQGATQSIFQKFVEIEVLPNDIAAPKALDVTATGVVAEGNELVGSYEFYQIDKKEDASSVKWVYSDTENGTYKDIPNADGFTYTVEEYVDKYIKFCVTPKTEDGVEGETVYSGFLLGPVKPTANNVIVTGDVYIGGKLTAEYTFEDKNYNKEGETILKWLVSDTENGTYSVVSGQTETTFELTKEYENKYIKFSVTPVSDTEPYEGDEVLSKAIMGPCAPFVTDVEIKKDGNRLQAVYTYNHPNSIKEEGTKYSWVVDGNEVSSTASYVIDYTGTKKVELTITPVCIKEPTTGESVTVSGSYTGYKVTSSGGGGYTGGGGGGFVGGGSSGTNSGVTNVNDMKLPESEKKPEEVKPEEPKPEEPKADIVGHWGEEYVKEMEKRGVMTPDAEGNFNPDKNATREEMLTYLFKALDLEKSDYENEFKDVFDGDFAKMLQTMVNNGTIAKDENFRPNDTISREEMCKILFVSLKNAGKLKEITENQIEFFADYGNIGEWAIPYVNGIYGNKIMVGVSDTEFDAKGTVSKAQAGTMLVRILKLTEEVK